MFLVVHPANAFRIDRLGATRRRTPAATAKIAAAAASSRASAIALRNNRLVTGVTRAVRTTRSALLQMRRAGRRSSRGDAPAPPETRPTRQPRWRAACGSEKGFRMDARHKHQRKFVAAKKAAGLERLNLWVRPEDKESLKMISQQPHAMVRYRAKVERDLRAKIERDLRPKIEREISARLKRRTMRAMLVQRRAQARRTLAASNRPPELIRFLTRPPAKIRNRLKSSGWLYDPVAAVWHLPDDPAQWPETERLLDELEQYGIERLALPP